MSDALDPQAIVRPLLRTRQVRDFTDQALTDAELHALTEVARWSGSSRNSQPWRFIVIRDRATIAAIQVTSMPQTRSLMTATSAIAITLPDDERHDEHTFDEGRVAERLLIAAGLLGLGAGVAWVRPAGMPEVRRILGLPEDRIVRTVVALGHPSEAAQRPKSAPGQARLPRTETVLEERWPS